VTRLGLFFFRLVVAYLRICTFEMETFMMDLTSPMLSLSFQNVDTPTALLSRVIDQVLSRTPFASFLAIRSSLPPPRSAANFL